MDWQEERARFWEDFELWDDKNEPVAKEAYVVYIVELPLHVKRQWKRAMYNPFTLWISVDNLDIASVQPYSYWYGQKYSDMAYEEQRIIIEYLCEFGYCEWKQIGPDDHELFATDKLTKQQVEERR